MAYTAVILQIRLSPVSVEKKGKNPHKNPFTKMMVKPPRYLLLLLLLRGS
jgi:hypothetical protein